MCEGTYVRLWSAGKDIGFRTSKSLCAVANNNKLGLSLYLT